MLGYMQQQFKCIIEEQVLIGVISFNILRVSGSKYFLSCVSYKPEYNKSVNINITSKLTINGKRQINFSVRLKMFFNIQYGIEKVSKCEIAFGAAKPHCISCDVRYYPRQN